MVFLINIIITTIPILSRYDFECKQMASWVYTREKKLIVAQFGFARAPLCVYMVS